MREPRKRRPPTYPSFYQHVVSILNALQDGGNFKKIPKKEYYTLDGIPVIISDNKMNFKMYRTDQVFCSISYRNMNLYNTLNTNLLTIITPSYILKINNKVHNSIEFPLDECDYFNHSVHNEEKIPEWEDIKYINMIIKYMDELDIQFMNIDSNHFYL